MTKADTARQYRDKFGMEMPSLKLARIMFANESILFKDVEQCRFYLRAIEGKGNTPSIKETHKMEEHRSLTPYKLPKSEAKEYKPFLITSGKVFLLSDVHVPYHEPKAIEEAVKYAKLRQVDTVLFNGDIIDCFKLSRFVKNPKQRDFAFELDVFKQFFDYMKDNFPAARFIYKFGNHEERYNHFLYEKAHELVGVKEFELSEIIKARANGIEIVEDKRVVKLGKLNCIHGHEYPGGFVAPVNVARGLYLKAKRSGIQGHSHQTSEHTETDINGGITTTYSLGALCHLNPGFMPLNKWNHGFAIVEIFKGGEFHVDNRRIYNGKIL
jgi:predicted phosphodiesterase